MNVKRLLKHALRQLGIRAVLRPRPKGWSKANLHKPGFDPRTVFDVGVGVGTSKLYQAFPDAYFVLIEPVREFNPYIERILQKYRGEHVQAAAGAEPSTLTINVELLTLQKSSFQSRTLLTDTGGKAEKRQVELTTLDALVAERGYEPPFGLKIDVEGYEAHVIRGARRCLRDALFVLTEVSVLKRFEDSYTFAEFVGLLDEHGFALCDIVRSRRTRHGEMIFADVLFKRIEAGR